MISRMSHVCIGTRDLPAQREFFCDLLGCEILHTFVNAAGETYGLILAAGDGAMIEMFNQEAPVESPGRFRHLCFQVEDIHKTAAYFTDKGFTVEIRHGKTDNVPQFFIEGPENLSIEFHQYNADFATYSDYLRRR